MLGHCMQLHRDGHLPWLASVWGDHSDSGQLQQVHAEHFCTSSKMSHQGHLIRQPQRKFEMRAKGQHQCQQACMYLLRCFAHCHPQVFKLDHWPLVACNGPKSVILRIATCKAPQQVHTSLLTLVLPFCVHLKFSLRLSDQVPLV